MSEPKLYRILQITFIAIIVGLVVPALIVFANGNRIHRTYWRARHAVDAGRYEQAAADLSGCMRERPRDPDGWGLLSKARFWAGDYQGALEALEAHLDLTALGDRPDMTLWHDYVWACAHGTQPVGMIPWWIISCRWREIPDELHQADRLMREARCGRGGYQEAAEQFEACLGQVPWKFGDMDALWGMATARFHAGDLRGSREVLERIRSEWGKQSSEPFEAVVDYVRSCVPGQPPPLGMPLVLRVWATYEESERQSGDGQG